MTYPRLRTKPGLDLVSGRNLIRRQYRTTALRRILNTQPQKLGNLQSFVSSTVYFHNTPLNIPWRRTWRFFLNHSYAWWIIIVLYTSLSISSPLFIWSSISLIYPSNVCLFCTIEALTSSMYTHPLLGSFQCSWHITPWVNLMPTDASESVFRTAVHCSL